MSKKYFSTLFILAFIITLITLILSFFLVKLLHHPESQPFPTVSSVTLETEASQANTPPTQTLTTKELFPQTPVVHNQTVLKNPCPVPKKDYADYSYLNVGQNIAIPDKTYVPADLVLLDKSISTSPICLSNQAAIPLIVMLIAAKEAGYTIKVSSGYRSYTTQQGILSNDIKSGNPHATELVAKPGYSEHQLGMAVDLTSPSINDASATGKFADTKEAAWLQDNAYKYGFIESYPEDKEEITGYMYEAWHYRFVGIANALAIFQSGETTNQYLEGLQN